MTKMTYYQQAALDKALALARLEPPIYVLPCWRRGKNKGPATRNGFYSGSAEEDAIRAMWADKPSSEVGVWPGPSCLWFEDIDVNAATAANGYQSLDRADVVWESVVHYDTPSGGEHHVWPALNDHTGPAAPILDFPGVDRRAGNSLCLWYGPVPSQETWTRMHQQTTPSWLAAHGPTMRSRSIGTPVTSVDSEEVGEWIDSLTVGPPIGSLVTNTEHYGPTVSALTALVEHTRRFTTWPGSRETFDVLADGYINSPTSSTELNLRPKKIVDIVRWALAKTADTEDLTAAYEAVMSSRSDDPVSGVKGHSQLALTMEFDEIVAVVPSLDSHRDASGSDAA